MSELFKVIFICAAILAFSILLMQIFTGCVKLHDRIDRHLERCEEVSRPKT